MKRVLVLLLLAGVIGGAVLFARKVSGLRPSGTPDGRVTLYGNVEIRDATLAFSEQERVTEVLVDEGMAVETGQVLAKLRTDRLEAQLAEAGAQCDAATEVLRRLTNGTRKQEIQQRRAEIEAAEARLANVQRLVARLKETARTGASSTQELDDAEANQRIAEAELNVRRQALDLALEGAREEDIAQAKANLEAAQARAALLETRLEDTVLLSPADGVIQARTIEVGEIAGPTRSAFVLALSEPKWVRAYVPEPQMGHVKTGMQATVLSDSFPDRPFTGRVGFISPTAEFTPKAVQTTDLRTQLVYEVRVWVEDADNELRLGMPVTVELDATGAPAPASDAEESKAAP